MAGGLARSDSAFNQAHTADSGRHPSLNAIVDDPWRRLIGDDGAAWDNTYSRGSDNDVTVVVGVGTVVRHIGIRLQQG